MPSSSIASNPKATTDPVNRQMHWSMWLFAGGTLVYLFLFYSSHQMRQYGLALMLVPDDLLSETVGGDWSRFGILDKFRVLMAAGGILVGAYFAGRLILNFLGVDGWMSRIELLVFSVGVGLNAWSTFTLIVGLAGLLQHRWIFGVGFVSVVIGALFRRDIRDSLRAAVSNVASLKFLGMGGGSRAAHDSEHPRGPIPMTGLGRLAVALTIPFAALIVLGGTLPPTQFDAREYHLQVPKEWFLAGRITFLPHNVYGNMPLGAELHAILGMVLMRGEDAWWWGTLAGKTLIAALAPLTALAILAAGRRFLVSPTAGAVAAFVFLSTPWIAHVSMTGLIDGASAFYMALAVYAALMRGELLKRGRMHAAHDVGPKIASGDAEISANRSTSASSESTTDRGLVALVGYLAGAGAACKYPALAFLVVPLFGLVTVLQPAKIQWRSALIYSVAVFAACGLWLGKNFALAGNPTYPLLYDWFGGKSWDEEKDARWTRVHGPQKNADGKTHSLAQLGDSARLITLRSDFLSPSLWPLALMASFHRTGRRRLVPIVALMVWTAAIWWLVTHRLDRFLIPLLPLAALCAGVGAESHDHVLWRRLVTGLLLWTFLANLVFVSTKAVADNRFLVSLHDLREDLPRTHDHSDTRIHEAHRYLNQHVRPGYRALLVGEAQVFDLAIPILYNTCFDDCIFEQLMKGKSRDERYRILRELEISHLYFSWRELRRYREPGSYGYSDYPTPERIHREFVEEQKLLMPVPIELNPEHGEIFEVPGWQNWTTGGDMPEQAVRPSAGWSTAILPASAVDVFQERAAGQWAFRSGTAPVVRWRR